MSDRRRHRGPHPRDEELFAASRLAVLRSATFELSWLLERGYASQAALALVGDRHALRARQRLAVLRCSCAPSRAEARAARRVAVAELAGRAVAVDGFNALITVEAALSGGVVLLGRDGVHRDLASVHGSYRRVAETARAVELLARALAGAASVRWLLDRPVSNSGRLARMIERFGEGDGLPWRVELVDAPDALLARSPGEVIASSDGPLLDRVDAWVDLPGHAVETGLRSAWIVDLRDTGASR